MSFFHLTIHRDNFVARRRTLLNRIRLAAAGLILTVPIATAVQAAPAHTLLAKSQPRRVAIVGDSLANDLGRGMEALFRNKPNVKVVKQTRFATGLMRTDYFNWNAKLSAFLRRHNPDTIIVLIGGNDSQSIRVGGKRLDRFTKPWLAEYSKRVDHFMDILKREHARVYWVGLPTVRSDKMTHNYRIMNGIFRRQAAKHGFKFISIWKSFADADGGYTSFGRSIHGVKRRLRELDGMHFTDAGNERLAAQVAREIGAH